MNNTGLLVGPHGAVSVDACATEARTRAHRGAIRDVTDRPVRTLVSTHHHGDHTHGNSLFRDATVVAHENTRTALLEAVGRPAHTTNGPVVRVPEHSVLYAGDLLFAGGTPFLLTGSITGAVAVLHAWTDPPQRQHTG